MVDNARARGLAERLRTLKPSATVEMSERVRAARAAGRSIIGLSSGDPNIETDPRIVKAATAALGRGETRYSSPSGEPALRRAIAQREGVRAGAHYDASDILVTPGGKFALLTALMATVEAGNEVIVPEPGWVSYGPCVRLCGGVPVALAMLDRIDAAAVEQAVTERTRAIIVNSPVNPTGRIVPSEEIEALIDVARRRGLWLIFDQVYSDLTYRGPLVYPQGRAGGIERTLVVDSLSKSFGMTGWRLGYLAAPPGIAKTVVKFIQHSIYCVPGFIQAAGIEALSLQDELVPRYRSMFRRRLERAVGAFASIDGISCELPDATFYLFPKVAGDAAAIARRWLDEIGVAVLPGSAFGNLGDGHLRLSLTCPDDQLETALELIARAGIAG